jgi:predicted ATPase
LPSTFTLLLTGRPGTGKITALEALARGQMVVVDEIGPKGSLRATVLVVKYEECSGRSV